MSERVLRVGLLGCGTVGSAVARLLHEHREDIARRAGCRLEITAVAVRDPKGERDVPLDSEVFVADPMAVIDDPDVDIVCELIGGNEPAGSLIMAAFDREKPVVTANKELLANRGQELFDASDAKGLDLYFEAAVGGGIPLIRPLKESLTGERLSKVLGIVNGTTNFVLTRMTEDGSGYANALAEAQRLGYAEADPDRRRRGRRRRGQVRDPRVDRVQRPGGGGRRLPGGHRERDPRGHRVRAASRLRREAARDRRDGRRRADRRSRPPCDDPGFAPARLGARGAQRGLRPGTERRRAHVLRPRCGRRRHGDRGGRRPRERRAEPLGRRPRRRDARASSSGRSARWRR